MSLLFRMLLTAGAVLTMCYFLVKIRKSKAQIEDIIFWLLFSLGIIVISVFPQIIIYFADLLSVQSPVNFLYLVIIFVLLVRLFSLTLKLSALDNKVKKLVQKEALKNAENEKE